MDKEDALRGQVPVTKVVGGNRQKLSMISTGTNQGKTRWQIIDDNFNHEKLIEFFEALSQDADREAFVESALTESRKLDPYLRRQFKKKLAERLQHPHVPQAKLRTLPGSYKIKLRRAGYRLVYRVDDEEIVVTVVAVGK